MKLYESYDRAYGHLIMPEAKKRMLKLIRECNYFLRRNWKSKDEKFWNSFAAMISHGGDIVLVIDGYQRYRHSGFDLFCPLYNTTYDKESFNRSYHLYNHQNCGKWEEPIPINGIHKTLKIKLGWLYGIGV